LVFLFDSLVIVLIISYLQLNQISISHCVIHISPLSITLLVYKSTRWSFLTIKNVLRILNNLSSTLLERIEVRIVEHYVWSCVVNRLSAVDAVGIGAPFCGFLFALEYLRSLNLSDKLPLRIQPLYSRCDSLTPTGISKLPVIFSD
jgi:hypothetical protein